MQTHAHSLIQLFWSCSHHMYMFVQNKIDPINLQRKIMEWARYTHVANLKADTH